MNRIFLLLFALAFVTAEGIAQVKDTSELLIIRTPDFEITGKGDSREWTKASWLNLTGRRNNGKGMHTRVKTMYSDKGMYFLFLCEDRQITSTMNADFMDLWKEDVVEVFIQTEKGSTAYFEYEVSPKNFELPILISNLNGNLTRWQPFHYEEDRKTKHATHIGNKANNKLTWTAEFFIPYALLRPLKNHVPASGTKWYGNFYRVDYDDDQYTSWTWQATRNSFHDIERFGTFVFE